MSGDVRVIADHGGTIAAIIDGLHDLAGQLADLPYALVGGLAVLAHVAPG